MFEQFSAGYYLGRLYVQPREGETAAMCRSQHDQVRGQLYDGGAGEARADRPLVMKLDETHFPVHGGDEVPADTLAVPRATLEGSRVRNPPTLREVLLATADRADQLLSLTGGRDDPAGEPTGI